MPPVQMFSDSSHPIACVFHLAFKAAAFVLYIFGSFLAKESKSGDGVAGSNFVVLTVVCILLSAADFWVVKNVTGRLLVGLRWWCQVEPDGTNRWIFESAETTNTNRFDNFVFWSVLYGTPTVWAFCLFLGIIKLNLGWLITACMALSLDTDGGLLASGWHWHVLDGDPNFGSPSSGAGQGLVPIWSRGSDHALVFASPNLTLPLHVHSPPESEQ